MRVTFEGECTVARAEEIRATLLEALGSGESLELDLSGVTRIDLSFCQLLHSLRKSLDPEGPALTVSSTLPRRHAGIARRCGLPDLAPGQ